MAPAAQVQTRLVLIVHLNKVQLKQRELLKRIIAKNVCIPCAHYFELIDSPDGSGDASLKKYIDIHKLLAGVSIKSGESFT